MEKVFSHASEFEASEFEAAKISECIFCMGSSFYGGAFIEVIGLILTIL